MSQPCVRSEDNLKEWALLFTTWILGIQLRPSELAANTFTHWGSSAVPWIHLRDLGIFNSSHTVFEKLNFCTVSLYEAFIESCERFLPSPLFAVEPSPLLGCELRYRGLRWISGHGTLASSVQSSSSVSAAHVPLWFSCLASWWLCHALVFSHLYSSVHTLHPCSRGSSFAFLTWKSMFRTQFCCCV